jgi:hypothetical protein
VRWGRAAAAGGTSQGRHAEDLRWYRQGPLCIDARPNPGWPGMLRPRRRRTFRVGQEGGEGLSNRPTAIFIFAKCPEATSTDFF